MKRFIPLFFLSFIAFQSIAQSVGIGTTTPHSSAIFEVSAPDKGVLVPRVSFAQRTAIPSPATGLLVFDTDTNTFWFFNGTTWANISPAALRATSNVNGLAGAALRAENTNASGIGIWSITNSSDANVVISNPGTGDLLRGFSGPSAGNLVTQIHNNGTITTTGNIGIGTSVAPTTRLEVNGNIKMIDGNQGINKVLTSDAAGTGVWRSLPGSVSFRAMNFNQQNFAINADVPIATTLEDYDISSNFFNSVFTAPSFGVYHFDVKATIGLPITENNNYLRFFLRLKRNGTVVEENVFHVPGNSYTLSQSLLLSSNISLAAGDVITISYRGDANPGSGSAYTNDVKFSGYKVN